MSKTFQPQIMQNNLNMTMSTCYIAMTNDSLFGHFSCPLPMFHLFNASVHIFIANVLCSLKYWQVTYKTYQHMKQWASNIAANEQIEHCNEVLHSNSHCVYYSTIIHKYVLINHKVL